MQSEEDSSHIALETLWRFRADITPLSQDELKHLYSCNKCLNCLGMCQYSETIEQAKRLQQGRAKRPGD